MGQEELWKRLSYAEKELLKRVGKAGSGNLKLCALRLGPLEPNFTKPDMETLEQLEFRRLVSIGRTWKSDELIMTAYLTPEGQKLFDDFS